MAYDNSDIPVNLQGKPIFWNDEAQSFQIWESNTVVKGSTLVEQLDETSAVLNVLTFSANIEAIEIYHEESTIQTFVVNGLSLKIASGGWRSLVGGVKSADVTIPAGVSCIVGRLV